MRVMVENNFIAALYDGWFDEGEGGRGAKSNGITTGTIYFICKSPKGQPGPLKPLQGTTPGPSCSLGISTAAFGDI